MGPDRLTAHRLRAVDSHLATARCTVRPLACACADEVDDGSPRDAVEPMVSPDRRWLIWRGRENKMLCARSFDHLDRPAVRVGPAPPACDEERSFGGAGTTLWENVAWGTRPGRLVVSTEDGYAVCDLGQHGASVALRGLCPDLNLLTITASPAPYHLACYTLLPGDMALCLARRWAGMRVLEGSAGAKYCRLTGPEPQLVGGVDHLVDGHLVGSNRWWIDRRAGVQAATLPRPLDAPGWHPLPVVARGAPATSAGVDASDDDEPGSDGSSDDDEQEAQGAYTPLWSRSAHALWDLGSVPPASHGMLPAGLGLHDVEGGWLAIRHARGYHVVDLTSQPPRCAYLAAPGPLAPPDLRSAGSVVDEIDEVDDGTVVQPTAPLASADRHFLFSRDALEILRWDLSNPAAPALRIAGGGAGARPVAASRDGGTLVVFAPATDTDGGGWSRDGTFGVRCDATAGGIAPLCDSARNCWSAPVALRDDGQFLAIAGGPEQREVSLWDLRRLPFGRASLTLDVAGPCHLAFSRDGARLAAVAIDRARGCSGGAILDFG